MKPVAWTWISSVTLGAIALFALGAWAADPDTEGKKLRSLFIVRQQIDGEITRLDPKTGVAVVKIPSGRLTLTSPELSTASLRKGDPVSLELRILPSGPAVSPASTARARDGRDPAIARQRLMAEVTGADVAKGMLTLQTSAGRVKAELPSNIVDLFKKGDFVPVELAVIPRMDPPARAGFAALLLSIFGKK